MGFIRVDSETGEIVARQKRFTKVMDNAFRTLAKDKAVTGLCWRCLALLVSEMGYDNIAVIRQSDIVKELGASPQKVSAALNLLAERRYITIDATRRPQAYIVSELIAQRGVKNGLSA